MTKSSEEPLRVVDRRWWARAQSDAATAEPEPERDRKPSYVEDLERQLADKTAQLQAIAAEHRRALDEFEQAKLRIRREVAREVERSKRAVVVGAARGARQPRSRDCRGARERHDASRDAASRRRARARSVPRQARGVRRRAASTRSASCSTLPCTKRSRRHPSAIPSQDGLVVAVIERRLRDRRRNPAARPRCRGTSGWINPTSSSDASATSSGKSSLDTGAVNVTFAGQRAEGQRPAQPPRHAEAAGRTARSEELAGARPRRTARGGDRYVEARNRRPGRKSDHADLGSVSRAAAGRRRQRFPLRDDVEPLRQPLARRPVQDDRRAGRAERRRAVRALHRLRLHAGHATFRTPTTCR